MNVTLPDGTVLEGVPEGASKVDILAKLQKINHPAAATLAQRMGGEMATKDTGTGGRILAGAGKAMSDLWLGTRQLVGNASQSEVDESKARDAALMKTGGGQVGNVLGGAATFAPTVFIPGANTMAGSAIAGTVMGALQPEASDDSRAFNAAMGGVLGAGGQALGQAVGRAIRPVAPQGGAVRGELVRAAEREGIPLTAGDVTGSRPLKIAESVMENMPLTAGSQLAQREAQQRAFTAAALRRAGMNADEVTGGALAAQKKNLGGQLGGIAERNRLDFNQGLTDRLASIVDDAAKRLPPDEASKVAGAVDRILSQVDETGSMLGTNYQGWREPLRGMASEGGATGRYLGQIRIAMDDAFRGQLQGAEGESFRDLSRQYANLKTIADSMAGSGSLPAVGQIPPTQLASALSKSVGRENKALGVGDLNELTRIGATFVRDQIPNSGTAQRALAQSLMTTGAGSAAGGALGAANAAAGGQNVVSGAGEGAMYGGAAGAASILAPKLIQSLMNSKVGQAYLSKGLLPIQDAERKAIADALRTLSIGSIPLAEGQ